MVEIFIDADACPVKDETLRVAARHGLKSYLVTDGGLRPSRDPQVELIIVAQGADAADDWIACMTGAMDSLGIKDELRTFLDERFVHTANFMRNQ